MVVAAVAQVVVAVAGAQVVAAGAGAQVVVQRLIPPMKVIRIAIRP